MTPAVRNADFRLSHFFDRQFERFCLHVASAVIRPSTNQPHRQVTSDPKIDRQEHSRVTEYQRRR